VVAEAIVASTNALKRSGNESDKAEGV